MSRNLRVAFASEEVRGAGALAVGGGTVAADPDETAALSVAIVPCGPVWGVAPCTDGVSGGGTLPASLPADPTDANMAGDEAPRLEPPAEDPPAATTPPALAPAAPIAPTAANPAEPTAIAPPARNAPAPIRSPPARAGDPPSTAANSLGMCQQSIIKMMEAPIISRADIAGLAAAAIFCASVIQSTDRFMPVPTSR